MIVGNEPNLNRFWLPQFGADGDDLAAPRATSTLLARSYDAVKAARPGVRVWAAPSPRAAATGRDGSRPTHSPTAFIRDLGAAYRASGRTRPLMDGFAFHPYMEASRVPPTASHPRTPTITVAATTRSWSRCSTRRSTGRRSGLRRCRSTTPSSASQTAIPAAKRGALQGTESPAAPTASASATQAGVLPPRARARRTASRPCAACSSSTPSTSRTSRAGSPASTSPTARPSRACPPSSARRSTCAYGGA